MSADLTPVLVGVGQHTDNALELDSRLSPLAMLELASERAAQDAGLTRAALAAVDVVVCVSSLSGFLEKPPVSLARAVDAGGARPYMTTTGGNSPQMLVNRFSEAIANGEAKFVLLTGS